MQKIKFTAIVLIFIMLFSTLTGCSVKKYNAVLYERANDWVDEDFYFDQENRVRAYYHIYRDVYEFDKYAPRSRTFIITSPEEFDEILPECPHTVDFDKEIVILYIFADKTYGKNFELRRMKLRDNVLTVKIGFDGPDPDKFYGSRATPSFMLIKMDRVEIDEVKIEIREN